MSSGSFPAIVAFAATIETEGLVGGNYLGITTGSDTAPIVASESVRTS